MAEFGQFHDGFLDGLLTEDDAVQFYLSTQERERFVIEASGVVALRVDGFQKGNIIFDVLVRKGEDITIHDVTSLMGFIDEAKAVAKLEEARKHLVVLEINPSYGASCIILAESVELLHRSL
jgi:hypothetical protein